MGNFDCGVFHWLRHEVECTYIESYWIQNRLHQKSSSCYLFFAENVTTFFISHIARPRSKTAKNQECLAFFVGLKIFLMNILRKRLETILFWAGHNSRSSGSNSVSPKSYFVKKVFPSSKIEKFLKLLVL